MSGAKASLILAVVIWALGGCSFIKLSSDLEAIKKQYRLIDGEVLSAEESSNTAPIVLVRYYQQGERHIARMYERLPDNNQFLVLLDSQPSYLIAIEDENRNGKYDKGERYGQYGEPTALTIDSPISDISIELNQIEPLSSTFVTDVLSFGIAYLPARQVNQMGAVSNLSELNIGLSGGKMGVWQPNKFLETKPLGILQLQPYSKDKTPVLFIHGMGGFPEQFSDFIDRLDRTRYQPWVYSYPSGMRLGLVSYHLNLLLGHLYEEYQFSEIDIVAHSMGGLVSKGALLRCGSSCPFSGVLTSIATPWSGHKSAKTGVAMAPLAVPSWFDMQPESQFLKWLELEKLPDSFKFNMAFAYRSKGLSRENNDGAVTLESQLAIHAQEDALDIRGFNETHTSILKSKEVYEWWVSTH
ncbi:esterase/lipase family protein [Corallincola platygyrae]|uniref:Esterase/lipase family protein n=1 Tax=Corallincola platygyrae TaxID=1193278 RepID=A0ABW4XK49_9GAMM